MRGKKMKHKIYLQFCLIAALAILITTTIVTALFYQRFKAQVFSDVRTYAYVLTSVDTYDEATLIQEVHQVDGIERIRLGSLEPGIITEEFAAAISSLPKVCPHFHLSLQSGCTTTLKRMNRRYTAEEYREKCEILRKYYPAPALTTDVITGFPGETEEEFEESRSFVDSIHFYETHIFPYSKREGTKAAGMPDQLTEQVKKERSRILIALGKEHQREYMEQFLGQEKEVLFEEQQTVEGQEYWTGHTMEYLKIAVISEENLENKRVVVQLREMIGQDLILAER